MTGRYHVVMTENVTERANRLQTKPRGNAGPEGYPVGDGLASGLIDL